MPFDAFVKALYYDLTLPVITRANAMCQLVERLRQDGVPDYLLRAAEIMVSGRLRRRCVGGTVSGCSPPPKALLGPRQNPEPHLPVVL